DPDAAAADARAAIAHDAGLAEAHNTLGAALVALGRPEDAVAALRAALDREPDHRMARLNLALALLATGVFAEGWDAYEHGWGLPGGRSPERGFPQSPWQGAAPADGGKLLVWGEQGLGDEVMYATVVPQLAAEGIACVLECDARLAALFARSLDGVEVVARRNAGDEPQDTRLFAPDIVAQTPSGSLPRHRRRDAASFAANRPAFLRPDTARAGALRARHHDGRPLVGISWHSKNPGAGRVKSMTLDLMAGTLARQGVKLVNLQYGDVAAEVAALRAARGITVHVDPEVDTWSDIDGLTALIEAMDLVVSVGNVTVHLAGAIGKPLWALLPHAADWRWTRGHDPALWYPSVRLFRQPAPGDWEGVLDDVDRALAAHIAEHDVAKHDVANPHVDCHGRRG
ncbi:MAG TPA: tetratricopeptide repeat protein, partial [Azospirillum sp.]